MEINRREFLSRSTATVAGVTLAARGRIAFAVADEPIDIGRETQLLIDDALVQSSAGLTRTLHQPQKQGLIKNADGSDFDRGGVYVGKLVCRDNAGKFHMTYRYYWWDDALQKIPAIGIDKAHWFHETVGYATSDDGIHWTRPDLGRFDAPERFSRIGEFPFEKPEGMTRHNNFGYPIPFARDLHALGNVSDPDKRFLLRVVENYSGTDPFAKPLDSQMYYARDWPEISDPKWKERLVPVAGGLSPRGEGFPTMCGYDHQAREWFMTCQSTIGDWVQRNGRDIARYSSPDLVSWSGPQIVLPVSADESKTEQDWVEYMDLWGHRVGGKNSGAWLGQLWIFHSDRSDPLYETPHMKNVWRKGTTEVRLLLSRDAGKTWQRVGDRQVWLPHHPDDDGFDRLPCLSCPIRVGDELRFYYACWNGEHLVFFRDGRPYYPDRMRNCSTAWATLRADGYVSLDAQESAGELRTKLLRFDGTSLNVNLSAPRGALRAELQDESGRALPGFALGDSIPLTGDGVSLKLCWQSDPNMKPLVGRPIRLQLELQNGSLYSVGFA